MPLYAIECVDKYTGLSADLQVQASDQDAACEVTLQRGLIISRIYIITPPPVSSQPPPPHMPYPTASDNPAAELREIRQTLRSMQADLNTIRLNRFTRKPTSTIAWGIVRGYVYIVIIGLAIAAIFYTMAFLVVAIVMFIVFESITRFVKTQRYS